MSESKLGLVERREQAMHKRRIFTGDSVYVYKYGWEDALAVRYEQLRAAVLEEAELAFKDAYSDYDDPLIGVMYGLKAIRALALLPPPEEKGKS